MSSNAGCDVTESGTSLTDTPRAKPFKLGFFTHVRTTSDRSQAHDELIRLFQGAEELGFDVGFVAQHLLSPNEEGSLPSPLVSLAAVAVSTSRIGIGTSVITLPVTDPVQLAEDALALDAISRGRLQLGIGTGGANTDKYAAFGVPKEAGHERLGENLAILLDALVGRNLRGGDAHLTVDGTGLLHRLWRSPGSVETANQTARTGLGALFGTATLDARTRQRPIIDAYLAQWAGQGPVDAPEEVRATLRPRLGGIRMIYPAPTREQALADVGPFLDRSRRRLATVKGIDADALTDAEVIEGVNLRTGTPQETADAIATDPALLPEVDYIIAVTGVIEDAAVGNGEKRTADAALTGLARIARDTAPLLGWRPAT